MADTKLRIIHAAADLFNTLGVAAVRLQQIADKAEVSVGNLAYHFKNKEAIVEAVYEELSTEIRDILKVFRQSSTLIDFDRQLSLWFEFTRAYSFYFSENLSGTDLRIGSLRAQMLSRLRTQIEKRFEYHEQRAVVHPTSSDHPYSAVAEALTLMITQWSAYRSACGEFEDEERRFKTLMWTQFLPHFTLRGKAEYNELIYPILLPSN